MVIVGSGGHASSVTESVLASGHVLAYFIDESGTTSRFMGYPVEDSLDALRHAPEARVVVAIGDNRLRQQCVERVRGVAPNIRFPAVVHPSAVISSTATLDEGTVVHQGAIVGSLARIGAFCIINTGASVDHQSVVEDFASLAPRSVTGGGVSIGTRSAIGLAAVLRHSVQVGSDTVVGASSYVHDHLPELVVAYGIPASVRRKRTVGEPYLQ